MPPCKHNNLSQSVQLLTSGISLRRYQVNRWFIQLIDETPEIQYHSELQVAGLRRNEHYHGLQPSARLDTLKSQQQLWKNPKGSWKREVINDWVHDTLNVRYYQNTWVRCRKEGELQTRSRWNSIQCACWETMENTVISDTWTLLFPFSFEGFAADPSRNLLFLLDTRTVPGESTFRWVPASSALFRAKLNSYRLWTLSLSSGSILDERLLKVDDPEHLDWLFYAMDSLDDLIGFIGFHRAVDKTLGGTCLVTLVDRATGKVIYVR